MSYHVLPCNTSPNANDRGAAVGKTDFQQQAYDLIAVNWVWKVLRAKGCSPIFISTMSTGRQTRS